MKMDLSARAANFFYWTDPEKFYLDVTCGREGARGGGRRAKLYVEQIRNWPDCDTYQNSVAKIGTLNIFWKFSTVARS